MLTNAPEFNSVGTDGFLGGGGGGIIGLLIALGLITRGGNGGLFGGDGNAINPAILAAIQSGQISTVAEFRAMSEEICSVKDAVKDGNYAAAIQAERNTNEILAQTTAFQVATNAQFDAVNREIAGVALQGERNTSVILNAMKDDRIRELEKNEIILANRLAEEREERRHDKRGHADEINIINTNTNINSLFQQQQQKQEQRDYENNRRFDTLFNQVAKSGQDIISVGSVLNGISQTANPVNVKS